MKKYTTHNENTLVEKILAGLLLVGLVLVLLWGCHLDAVETPRATVYSKTETEVCFEVGGHTYGCYADNTNNIKLDDVYIIKLDNMGTIDKEDDKLLDFGKHCFLGFVF